MSEFKDRILRLEQTRKRLDSELIEAMESVPAIRSRLHRIVEYHARGRCPACRKRIKAGGWLVNRRQKSAICCRCFSAVLDADHVRPLFSLSDVRFEIDGEALRVIRESLGISLKEFARIAGWSRPYQTMIECGRYVTLGIDKVEMLMEVITIGRTRARHRRVNLKNNPLTRNPIRRG